MNRPLALVGLRCSGKTTVGKLLAEHLGVAFVDSDEELAARWCRELDLSGVSAGKLLERHGLEAFREREAVLLRELIEDGAPRVIATGGGCVEDPSTRQRLTNTTECIWLRARPEILAERIQADNTLRPPLTDEPDLIHELRVLELRRGPLYTQVAGRVIDADERTPAELAREIHEQLNG